jgi:hypothetical protein
MTNLVSAYQKKEIREFEKILKGKLELLGSNKLKERIHRSYNREPQCDHG